MDTYTVPLLSREDQAAGGFTLGCGDRTLTAFLESIEREAPDFALIGLPHAADLPGVRRKLTNMGQRSAAKRTADYEQLKDFLRRSS